MFHLSFDSVCLLTVPLLCTLAGLLSTQPGIAIGTALEG